jgi:hypothetical protein
MSVFGLRHLLFINDPTQQGESDVESMTTFYPGSYVQLTNCDNLKDKDSKPSEIKSCMTRSG